MLCTSLQIIFYKLFSFFSTISIAISGLLIVFDVVALCLYLDQFLTDFTWSVILYYCNGKGLNCIVVTLTATRVDSAKEAVQCW